MLLFSLIFLSLFIFIDSGLVWIIINTLHNLNPWIPQIDYLSAVLVVVLFKILDGSLFEEFMSVVVDDEEDEE